MVQNARCDLPYETNNFSLTGLRLTLNIGSCEPWNLDGNRANYLLQIFKKNSALCLILTLDLYFIGV